MQSEIGENPGIHSLPVCIENPDGRSAIVLVCEHASNFIPEEFANLGLDARARDSHVAWDPGAYAVARHLSALFDAVLVSSRVSRLVYDCNRAPDAPDAMPARSELFDIPGNTGLSSGEKSRRVAKYYHPFRNELAQVVSTHATPAMLVTVHSFTPVYMGRRRAVELGILHDSDSRLADEMLRIGPAHTDLNIERNQPYSAQDGVTHTLKVHAIANGLPNVMLEIRSDKIATKAKQRLVAAELLPMLGAAINSIKPVSPPKAAI